MILRKLKVERNVSMDHVFKAREKEIKGDTFGQSCLNYE